MIEAIFFAIARHPEFELGIIFFGSLADGASVKSFVCGRFILELALAHIRSGPISQFRDLGLARCPPGRGYLAVHAETLSATCVFEIVPMRRATVARGGLD